MQRKMNENEGKIIEIAEKANLNFIQLHGNEQPEFISDLRQKLPSEIKIIKEVSVKINTYEFILYLQIFVHF